MSTVKIIRPEPPPPPPPMCVIELTVLEAQELRAALCGVYGLETDVENRLVDALQAGGWGTRGPFESYKDRDGDLAVRRRQA